MSENTTASPSLVETIKADLNVDPITLIQRSVAAESVKVEAIATAAAAWVGAAVGAYLLHKQGTPVGASSKDPSKATGIAARMVGVKGMTSPAQINASIFAVGVMTTKASVSNPDVKSILSPVEFQAFHRDAANVAGNVKDGNESLKRIVLTATSQEDAWLKVKALLPVKGRGDFLKAALQSLTKAGEAEGDWLPSEVEALAEIMDLTGALGRQTSPEQESVDQQETVLV